MSYPTYSDLELEIQDLEEENKFLKSEIELLKKPRFSDRCFKKLEEENKKLKEYNGELIENHKKDISILCEENRKLKSEIENMKEVGRENIETLDRMSIELENYSESFKRYRDFSKQELADSLYDAEEQNKKLKEEIDNGFNRETDLRNKRADSLLENKDLRDKIEELEKEIEELNKMMLFETELEK